MQSATCGQAFGTSHRAPRQHLRRGLIDTFVAEEGTETGATQGA
ncbi:hypothetical protein OG762_20520 [Streptomyces sp. NBC_01136]|nr:hypothetical protein OG762_20520 [Streptomyces sp. NBC_01136]